MEHTTATGESARALSLRGSESGDKWLEPLCGFLPLGGRPVVPRSPGCRTWPRVLRIGPGIGPTLHADRELLRLLPLIPPEHPRRPRV